MCVFGDKITHLVPSEIGDLRKHVFNTATLVSLNGESLGDDFRDITRRLEWLYIAWMDATGTRFLQFGKSRHLG